MIAVSWFNFFCWCTVVFMGSEKYPNDNDFDNYLSQHGGSSNAYTECEQVGIPSVSSKRLACINSCLMRFTLILLDWGLRFVACVFCYELMLMGYNRTWRLSNGCFIFGRVIWWYHNCTSTGESFAAGHWTNSSGLKFLYWSEAFEFINDETSMFFFHWKV